MSHTSGGNVQLRQIKTSDLSGGLAADQLVTTTGALTADRPLLYDANGNAVIATVQGNGTKVQMASGSPTTGFALIYDASGNAVPGSGAPLTNPMTTKGDVIVAATGGTPARLAVGTNGQVPTANSAATNGVDWEAPIAITTTGTSGAAVLTPGNPYSLNIPQYSGGSGGGFGPLVSPTAPPSIASFTWVNQGGATATNPSGSAIALIAPASGSFQIRALVISAPATPYIVDAYVMINLSGVNYQTAGLCFRNSSSGKLTLFYVIASSGAGGLNGFLGVDYCSSATVAVSNLTRPPMGTNQFSGFLRIADDGTNRKYSISVDGLTFTQIYSEARTTNFTADQVGFYANDQSGAAQAALTLISWYVH